MLLRCHAPCEPLYCVYCEGSLGMRKLAIRLISATALMVCQLPARISSIRCYECTGGQDNLCEQYVGRTCEYGFFGCIKIGAFSGGVDKCCNMLPIGGVDACQQQVLLGMRIVSCYCFSDYCNEATSFRRHSPLCLFVSFAMTSIALLLGRIFHLYSR